MRCTERLRLSPRFKYGTVFPDGMGGVERVILSFGAPEKVKLYKARDFFEMTVIMHPQPQGSKVACHLERRSTPSRCGARSLTRPAVELILIYLAVVARHVANRCPGIATIGAAEHSAILSAGCIQRRRVLPKLGGLHAHQ
jgi:hypothetical protein